MLLDLSDGGRSYSYVEDCENCCNPIAISFEVEDAVVASFSADAQQ